MWSLQGFSAFVPTTEDKPSEIAGAPFHALQVLSAGDLESGVWSFGDENWELTAETLADARARKQLFEAPEGTPPTSQVHRDETQDLLRLFREYGKRFRTGPYWMYELQHQGFHIVAFESEQPSGQLVSIRWLIPLSDGRSWLLEQRARSDFTQSGSGAGNIFSKEAKPAITSAPGSRSSRDFDSKSLFKHWPHQVLAQHFDQSGRTLCQLVQLDATFEAIVEGLSRDSWQINLPEDRLTTDRFAVRLSRGPDAYWLMVASTSETTGLRLLLMRDEPISGEPEDRVLVDEEP